MDRPVEAGSHGTLSAVPSAFSGSDVPGIRRRRTGRPEGRPTKNTKEWRSLPVSCRAMGLLWQTAPWRPLRSACPCKRRCCRIPDRARRRLRDDLVIRARGSTRRALARRRLAGDLLISVFAVCMLLSGPLIACLRPPWTQATAPHHQSGRSSASSCWRGPRRCG